MSDATINQLRTQLTTQLKEKNAGLAKLQTAQKQLTAEIAALNTRIAKFDEVFGATGAVGKTRKKPGPKPKVSKPVVAKASTKTGGRKPGPKPKATTTGTKKVSRANSRATQGRRAVAQGLRPPIRKAMIEVIGKKTMNAQEMYEALKAKNWLPDSSDPRAYISYLFSSLKDTFQRVEGKRGFYQLRDGVTAEPARKSTTKAQKTETTTVPETNNTSSTDVDDVLKEAGVIPAQAAN